MRRRAGIIIVTAAWGVGVQLNLCPPPIPVMVDQCDKSSTRRSEINREIPYEIM